MVVTLIIISTLALGVFFLGASVIVVLSTEIAFYEQANRSWIALDALFPPF
jgi:hypothetical protein